MAVIWDFGLGEGGKFIVDLGNCHCRNRTQNFPFETTIPLS